MFLPCASLSQSDTRRSSQEKGRLVRDFFEYISAHDHEALEFQRNKSRLHIPQFEPYSNLQDFLRLSNANRHRFDLARIQDVERI